MSNINSNAPNVKIIPPLVYLAGSLDWLANEVSGQPDQTVVVLDEYVAELADKARDAGLILILLDGPPLQAA